MSLNVQHVRRDPRRLRRLGVNARYMVKATYDQLVANIRQDGCLTSWPLVWGEPGGEAGRELVLSGNHRCDAAVDAGLEEVDAILLEAPDLPRAKQLAIQLSHNSIAGADDLATLKQLYDEIDDVDQRAYAGLDDKTLELLEKVDMEGLTEANLDFATVMLVFLPPELAAARKALDSAPAHADQTWLVARADYEKTLDSLDSAHGAYNVGNTATAFWIILEVFERHLTDLADGYDPGYGIDPLHKAVVGFETVFGTRTIPSDLAVKLNRAVKAAMKSGAISERWQLLEQLTHDIT